MARVFKRNHWWWIDFRDPNGRRVMRKAKSPYKDGAQAELYHVLDTISKGIYEGKAENKSFEEAVKGYLAWSKSNKMESSFRRDETSFVSILPFFKKFHLKEIHTKMIEDYKSQRLENRKPATVNRELALTKHMFNKAISWGWCKDNPVKGVKMLREQLLPPRFLSMEEIEKLLNACSEIEKKSPTAKHLRAVVLTALHTGLRKNNVLNLTWNQVDLKSRRITVPITKNHDPITVPIDDTLLEELKNLGTRFKGGFVFSDDEAPRGNVRTGFASALKLAAIDKCRFHDLRHTFASQLVMAGSNLRSVQMLLGHRDIKMTLRYAHLSQDHLLQEVNRLAERMKPNGNRNLDLAPGSV